MNARFDPTTKTTSLTCLHCGAALPSDARFCPRCATPILASNRSAIRPLAKPRGRSWFVPAVVVVLLLFAGAYGWHRYVIHQQLGQLQQQFATYQHLSAALDKNFEEGKRILREFDLRSSDGTKAGQKRHDEALSQYPDETRMLELAKQEQRDVDTLPVGELASNIDAALSDEAQILGADAVTQARSDAAELSTQLGLFQSNWARAIGNIVDNLKSASAVTSDSDLDHYYQESTNAQTRAQTAMTSLGHDFDKLHAMRLHALATLHDEIAGLQKSL